MKAVLAFLLLALLYSEGQAQRQDKRSVQPLGQREDPLPQRQGHHQPLQPATARPPRQRVL